jgi:hypothetical protein
MVNKSLLERFGPPRWGNAKRAPSGKERSNEVKNAAAAARPASFPSKRALSRLLRYQMILVIQRSIF